jgi:hypothetical protein
MEKTMIRAFGFVSGIVLWTALGQTPAGTEPQRVPVLVELFTSEGCSSCPPADALLQGLDRQQPIPGVFSIVMSEHVDYWNSIGWVDPYSSAEFSRRQEAYARRFGLNGPYTPQMVVDGSAEFVGNDVRRAESVIGSAARQTRLAVRFTETAGMLRLEVDPLPAGGHGRAGVYLAFADDARATNVLRGENRGRKLQHVAVVHRIRKIGGITRSSGFTYDFDTAPGERTIAFVQEGEAGRVLGAAMRAAPAR